MEIFERMDRERARLRNDRKDRLKDITQIDAELADWDAVERIFRKARAEKLGAAPPAPPSKKLTVKVLAAKILRDIYPQGFWLSEIQRYAMDAYSHDLNINSLSVSLQRLKEDGKARVEKKRWYFIKDAPPEQTDGAP